MKLDYLFIYLFLAFYINGITLAVLDWWSFLSKWDPMITTLPGLYLVSVGVVKPASWLLGWSEHVICSIGVLRFVNLLFSVGNFYLLYLLFRKVQPRNKVCAGYSYNKFPCTKVHSEELAL
jgi:hypothetical protein